MPRNYVRKTNRACMSAEIMERAIEQVILEKRSIRSVAKEFDISVQTLSRYCRKFKKSNEDDGNIKTIEMGYTRPRQIFTDYEECALVKYIKTASDIYGGLVSKEVRKFAFQFGSFLKTAMPDIWHKSKQAGPDWLISFLKRHNEISLRKYEATTTKKESSFDPAEVQHFFNNLKTTIEKMKFKPENIYNMDESGVCILQNSDRVVPRRYRKQHLKVVSPELGTFVTVAVTISAAGTTIPPYFVFLQEHFGDHFTSGGPSSSVGGYNPSGWMDKENFLDYLNHFVRNAKCSKEKPALLLLDNHDSHLSISALNFISENGITIMSFPTHSSRILQPLDRTIYKSLKEYVTAACDSWVLNYPRSAMTIYDIPGIIETVLPLVVTPGDIMDGFAVSGISPFNPGMFDDGEFSQIVVIGGSDSPSPSYERDNADEEDYPSDFTDEASQIVNEFTFPSSLVTPSSFPMNQTLPSTSQIKPTTAVKEKFLPKATARKSFNST